MGWDKLPASFREDVEAYLAWCEMPDPLDDRARARALAPRTRELRRNHLHSAVTAAVASGIAADQLSSLAALVEAEALKAMLRHMWKENGGKLSAYTHGVAGTLVAVAKEWARLPADKLEILKGIRRKLGSLAVQPAGSGRAFLLYQDALAIDILLHAPLRMENLASLSYERHLRWVQGQGKPALLVIGADETKNHEKIELELPATLADRLWTFRNAIAPQVIGSKPNRVFVTWAGTPRGQGTLALAISKIVRRRLGVNLTPHQFRHFAAKIYLDRNPGGFELVRQLLGHKNLKTTINAYAGINTKRAGRAHARLLMEIMEQELARPGRKRQVEE